FFKAVSVVAAALVFMVAASTFNAAAQRPQRTIVIVEDEGSEDTLTLALKREIGAIVADTNEARIRSVPIPAGATDAQIDDILQRIYAAPDTSVVVIADISLNQSFARKTRFAKPTLLPFVFDAGFSGLKKVGETSGTKNLTYTAPDFEFIEEFETFASVAPIKNAVLLSSDRVVRAISESTKTKARAAAKSLGFSIEIVAYDTAAGALSKPLARDVDTVFVGVLPEVSNAQIRALLSQLTAQGIATYALASEQFVELGALATNAPSADTTRLARRAAINVAELLAGVPAQSLPVSMNLNDQLTINMATARALKVAPPFDVLLSARLLNDIDESAGPVYSLTQVARQAVSANLALMAQRFQAQQAQARISETRGALLPQVSAGLSYLQRRQTNNVQAGFAPQSTTDGSITLSQSIFTEEFWAAYAIEKYSALSEKALLREVELDIIQAAVETYLAILREKTSLEQAVFNLDITRENQRLARNRVDVGTEDASDLFRWQSELATAKQTVLAANAGYEQLRQQLNQILNRPINEPFSVTIETLENPDLLIVDERITSLISNAYDLEVLSDYFVEVGLERSPEIDQAEVAIKSNARQLKSNKRQFWLPDISLVGQYSNNLDEDRVLSMVGLPAQDDWSVTVQASIDLFEGGARFSRVEQSRLAVRQSQTSLRNIENQVEQDIRNALEVMTASFTSIPLARDAEVAAQKNYDLVAEAYAQGKRDIINVLDAQDALVDAREAALNAVYNFLINLMTTQRAIGGFDFFLDDREKLAFNNEL
ncbi:MAG: TolC family protein, partial [Pseudomonadota bacterium]